MSNESSLITNFSTLIICECGVLCPHPLDSISYRQAFVLILSVVFDFVLTFMCQWPSLSSRCTNDCSAPPFSINQVMRWSHSFLHYGFYCALYFLFNYQSNFYSFMKIPIDVCHILLCFPSVLRPHITLSLSCLCRMSS